MKSYLVFIKKPLYWTIIISLAVSEINAAIPTFHGYEEDCWTTEKRAVIVALVKAVEAKGRTPGEVYGTLQPIVTLAGNFDASLNRNLEVLWRANLEGFQSSLQRSPRVGNLIVVVIRPPDPERMDPAIVATGRYVVPVDRCLFMRNEEPLVVLTDLKDPEIEATLKRIQEVRLKPATTNPTTRPKN